MKILIVSYGIKEYDGRLKELGDMLANIGEVELLCCSVEKNNGCYFLSPKNYLTRRTYMGFMRYVIEQSRRIGKIDMLVCDNLFAALPTIIVRRILKPQHIIQDVRELYLFKQMHGSSKFFAFFERSLMRRATVVLTANQERAEIVRDAYHLNETPLVFENVRFLEGDTTDPALREKYRGVFKYRINVLSTSGLYMERDSDKLILAMKQLPSDYGLFFVGQSSDADVEKYKQLCEQNGIDSVHLIGRVPMDELKYIVQQCQIGAVHYHKRNLNNLYCASGKIYEFLHEGLPIVTTENPPLKNFCDKTQTGIADDSFHTGIRTIADRYDTYKRNVQEFMQDVSPQRYNAQVAKRVADRMRSRG